MNLGANIKKVRKSAGVTQKELAERLQVYQKDISRWENNELTPSSFTLEKICNELGASADEILELRKGEKMQRYYKIGIEEARATRIKADATKIMEKEGVDGYAKAWLKITNIVRGNKSDLFKTYNDYENNIYIVCAADEYIVESTKNYLEQLGLEVVGEEKVVTVVPDEVFNDDLAVELIEW